MARRSRIYWRERGGHRRAYGDFRDYSDAGGGQEALIARGERRATADPVVADYLVADRLKELQERRRNRTLLGVERQNTLKQFAAYHLIEKARSAKVTEDWLVRSEMHLRKAIDYLGADRDLASIQVKDVQGFTSHLTGLDNGRGGTLSASSARKYLNSLSNLYRRAQAEGYVPPGYNPVSALMDKPADTAGEARWLEVPDAALLLESARTFKQHSEAHGMSCAYPLVATFLLTGGRRSEVLGLELDDVNFDRKTVTFRPNDWRRLKTPTSHRSVPLWPQLEEILRGYIFGGTGPMASGLLFPSVKKPGSMIVDTRKTLDAIATRVGWGAGEIRTKIFRHTYCAARLQTLDRGYPVSEYTVARELGHGGFSMVRRVYGHLGQIRHRAEVLEYRVEQHVETLGPRLAKLRAGTQ